ncbi:hypothetical protein B0H14DRAFT_3434415 [Mycena olivaceomarginata]|nr:hypothetical protein B0H14DRAFT_3434415 [Mycena olivaceomarginata]
MSDYLPIVNDTDLQKDNPQWNPSEWIGCGRTIADVPHFVAAEAARTLEIPIEIKSSLPPETLAPSEFFASSMLPPWDPDINTTEISLLVGFDATHPSFNPSSPCNIQLLPLATVRQLRSTYGQAWLDRKTSIRDARTPGHVRFYLLWALSYIELTCSTVRSLYHWGRTIAWTMQEREDEETEAP